MPAITVLPDLVTSAGATNEVLTISEAIINKIINPILKLTVVTGTFKFAAGQTAANSSAEYTAGEFCTITILQVDEFRTDPLPLNFIAANSGETFKVEAI